MAVSVKSLSSEGLIKVDAVFLVSLISDNITVSQMCQTLNSLGEIFQSLSQTVWDYGSNFIATLTYLVLSLLNSMK